MITIGYNYRITDLQTSLAISQLERINEFILQAGSKDKFEEMVGMPMRKIKSEYWNEIKNMLYVEKFKYNNVQNINISRQEVELFYQSFKDSIPIIPEYYNFSVIDIPFEASKKTKKLTVSIFVSVTRESESVELVVDVSDCFS